MILHPPLFAAGLVLAVAASGSGDYVLTIPGERICAKSEHTCEKAREAIQLGRWPIVSPETPTRCTPAPGCFSPESLVIREFNDK